MTYGNSLVHVCTRTIVKGALLEARPCSMCTVFRSEVLVRRRTVSTCIYYWSASIVPVGSSPYDSGNAVQADNFAAPLPLQKDGATGQFSIRRIISYFLNISYLNIIVNVCCLMLFVRFLPGWLFCCCNATGLSKARRNCAGHFKRTICTYLNRHDVHKNHGAMRRRNVDWNRFELEDT